SGCEVANDWLDRLVRSAAAARDVATVVPFASAGGIAGDPRSEAKNAVPKGPTVASLDLLFRRANAGRAVEWPASPTPLVDVPRECLKAMARFDDGAAGVHYGVGQGFGMRASEAGFRHLLATDVYVRYEAALGVEEDYELGMPARGSLNQLHPQYQAECAAFALPDPRRPY